MLKIYSQFIFIINGRYTVVELGISIIWRTFSYNRSELIINTIRNNYISTGLLGNNENISIIYFFLLISLCGLVFIPNIKALECVKFSAYLTATFIWHKEFSVNRLQKHRHFISFSSFSKNENQPPNLH